MSFKFKHFFVLLIAATIIAVGIFIRIDKERKAVEFDFSSTLSNIMQTLPSEETKFANELKNALNEAFTKSNVNDKSFLMVNASVKTEESEIPIDKLSVNPDFQREFYIASLFKPFFVAAYIDIMNVEDLEYKIPFKFVKEDGRKTEIANRIFEYLNHDTVTDPLLVNVFAKDFKNRNLSIDEIYDELVNSEKYKNFEFSFKDLLTDTLGPSSNWGILILRDHMSLNGYEDDKGASSALEDYVNEFLKVNNLPETFRFFLSEKADKDKKYNSTKFYELEFLFDSFYKNSFEIPAEIHKHLILAMEDISDNPSKSNRRHEIKSISKQLGFTPKIEEKSGYIGFDFAATPALDQLNGWDLIPTVKDKRLIILNISSYSRIHLKNGEFIDLFYALASPTHLSLDPYYEEFNDEYLDYKNNILDNIETSLKEILQQHADLLEVL